MQRQNIVLYACRSFVRVGSLLWYVDLPNCGRSQLTPTPGGLYFQTGITIAGFQSRVGCLFFLVRHDLRFSLRVLMFVDQGALIAFSSLSALYNVVEIRPLFLRERSSSYYR